MEKFEKKHLETETLEQYGTDLTKMAEEGKLDPVIGRQREIERVIQILCKRRKNNPCLIGEPGVGKTMIAEGLAQRISNAMVPPNFSASKVFSIDMGRLISGASLRGEFEGRLLKVVDEVTQSNGAIILFIDELHALVGAGDAANILKPFLARGELKCIGATTFDEYRKYIEKDPALKRRFQPVEVPEPTVVEAVLILKGLCHKYSVHHNVRYRVDALEAAVHLSKQYISDRFLPDKAIDLIDESGSLVRLRQTQKTQGEVTETDIQQVVSSWTGVPIETVSSKESIRLLAMEKTLSQSIVGQLEAVEAVSRVIRRARVGIPDPSRPIASLLFTGPTRVGKTEVAKVVASEYFGSKEKGMVRIDMSEYMEKHTVSRLIGSPPGYVGHDEGGQLTEAVRRHPHKLVLFDEIEKAHRDVFDMFLQILDDGRLTDGKGRTVDFSNTIIVMTSNVGGGGEMQNKSGPSYERRAANELKRMFRPEFLNRIDDVIVFKSLGKAEMRVILDKMLKQVCERLWKVKKVRLKVTDEAKDKLMEEGYSCSYGARLMRRAITKLVEDGLAERILRGEVKEGQTVTMDIDWKDNIFYIYG